MRLSRLHDGDFIYRAGGAPDAAFVVRAGCVVLGAADATLRPVTRIGPGEAFGAIEILIDSPRLTWARAEGAVEIAVYDADELRAALRSHPAPVDAAIAAALTAARPVAAATAAPVGATAQGETAHGEVRLVGLTRIVTQQLDRTGVVVTSFPFVVGRKSERSDGRGGRAVALALDDAVPYQLSRNHFMIDRVGSRIVIHDCGSHNGTIVNGTHIGADADAVTAELQAGSNEIVAGRATSPFRFDCIVPESDVIPIRP